MIRYTISSSNDHLTYPNTPQNPTSHPSKIPSFSPSQSPVIPCGTKARIVKIESMTGQIIHVFEVEVYSEGGQNVAVGKHATQSSTPQGDDGSAFKTFDASRAVDGSASTFSETADSDSDPWWQVDLGGDYFIQSVQILNRYCVDHTDPNGCLCRLSNATVSLIELDQTSDVVATRSLGDTCDLLNIGVSFSDDAVCPQRAFVVNSVARSSSQLNSNNPGSPSKAILASILGIAVFLILVAIAYRGRKRIQQQQRRDKLNDSQNLSSFVRRGRRQRSQGLYRKSSGQHILDQLEDNSLIGVYFLYTIPVLKPMPL
jgi:hypothetical protein